MSELFSTQEDELNILFDKLTKIISTFTTLSRELKEKAIIETNLKIKEGETMIEKMENFMKNNENGLGKDEMIELNKKINNYKIEFNNLKNKFNITQKAYINKKAENALIDDIEININNKKNILIDDDSINKKEEKNKNYEDNNFKNEKRNSINNNINSIVFEKNIGVNNTENINNISDEVFNSINIKANKKKKKIFCGILIILSVVIISVILFFLFFMKKFK